MPIVCKDGICEFVEPKRKSKKVYPKTNEYLYEGRSRLTQKELDQAEKVLGHKPKILDI